MNPWQAIKRRFTRKNAAKLRNKIFAGAELVAAGAALTGGALLLEEAAKPGLPQASGHDNVIATDNGASIFKVETLGGQEDETTTSEIIGWVIFTCLFIILAIILSRAVIKVKKTCGHRTSGFKMGKLVDEKEAIIETTSAEPNPEIKAQLDNKSLEEAIKKARENFAALEAIKDPEKSQTK